MPNFKSIKIPKWTPMFVLAFMISNITIGQSSLELDKILESNDSLEIVQRKADSLFQNWQSVKRDSIHYSLHDYAIWLYDNKAIERAIETENLAFKIANETNPVDVDFAQTSGVYLGYYQKLRKQYLKSIEVFEKTILIDPNSKRSTACKDQLGSLYRLIYDYPKSLEYYQYCISDFQGNTSLEELRGSYINAADVSRRIGGEMNLKKGIRYAEKADSLSKLLPFSNRIEYSVNLNLARLYNQYETLDVSKSEGYYKKALEVTKRLNNVNRERNILLNLGNLYNTTDSEVSLSYFDKALALTKPTDSFRLYQAYQNIGMLHGFDGDYKKGIDVTLRGLEKLTLVDFKSPENIDYNFLRQSKYKRNLLIAVPILAEIYLKLYEESGDFEHLKKSLSYFQISDAIIDVFQEQTSEYKSKLFWRKISADIYGKAIRACYLLKDSGQAFYFMEKNKALLLKQDIGQLNYKKSIEIPKAILDRELAFKERIFQLRQFTGEHETDHLDVSDLKKELVEKQLKLKSLQDSLGFRDGFFNDSKILSLKEAQQSLKENELVLEYHVSIDDGQGVYTNIERGYALAITKEEVSFYEIPDMIEIRDDVVAFRRLLDEPFKTTENQNQYNGLAYSIFSKLFPGDHLKEQIKGKNLNIIPDSYLSFIPFEALSSSKQNLKYLIEDSEFHYSYSCSFIEQIRKPAPNKVNYIAFSPENFDKLSLSPLRNSSRELEFLDKYFTGRGILKHNANKSTFVSSLIDVNIIHIASHADASSDEAPWIAFEDDRLHLEEIYLTENNASLVFLSGCNTTIGKQEIGEGIMSLARGFFYSGAQSVISSLWKIDDASTPQIVDEFYRNLSNGESKSEALHHAKLSYLENSTMSNSSPHYWASLVLLGQDDILVDSSWPWLTIVVIGLFLLLLFLFGKRIRRMFAGRSV